MNRESFAFEIETQQFADVGLVFNYQYLLAHTFTPL
jgi:hypothetical protein